MRTSLLFAVRAMRRLGFVRRSAEVAIMRLAAQQIREGGRLSESVSGPVDGESKCMQRHFLGRMQGLFSSGGSGAYYRVRSRSRFPQ